MVENAAIIPEVRQAESSHCIVTESERLHRQCQFKFPVANELGIQAIERTLLFYEQEMSVFQEADSNPEKFRVITITGNGNESEEAEKPDPLVLTWPIHPNELSSIYEYVYINSGKDKSVEAFDSYNLPQHNVENYRRKVDAEGNYVINKNCPLLVALCKLQTEGALPFDVKIIVDPLPLPIVEGRRGQRVEGKYSFPGVKSTGHFIDFNRVAKEGPDYYKEIDREYSEARFALGLKVIGRYRVLLAEFAGHEQDELFQAKWRQLNEEFDQNYREIDEVRANRTTTVDYVKKRADALVNLYGTRFPNSTGLNFHADLVHNLRFGDAETHAEEHPGTTYGYQYVEKYMEGLSDEQQRVLYDQVQKQNQHFMSVVHQHFKVPEGLHHDYFASAAHLEKVDYQMPPTTSFDRGLIYNPIFKDSPFDGSIEPAVARVILQRFLTAEMPGFINEAQQSEWIEIYLREFAFPLLAGMN